MNMHSIIMIVLVLAVIFISIYLFTPLLDKFVDGTSK